MERQKISEIARKLGVSCQSVYKKLARSDIQLTAHIFKSGNATFLDEEGFTILAEMFGKVNPKLVSPIDTQVDNLMTTIKEQLKEKQQTIESQQRTIESLIAQNEEQRKRTDTILMKLTSDISTLQKCLEYKKSEPSASTAVSATGINPQKKNIPAPIRAEVIRRNEEKLDGLPWYQKLWIDWFEPERLRRFG